MRLKLRLGKFGSSIVEISQSLKINGLVFDLLLQESDVLCVLKLVLYELLIFLLELLLKI